MSEIKKNLSMVRDKIAKAARRSDRTANDIRLVLVSKTIAAAKVKEAIEEGQVCLGENKVQEGLRKAEDLKEELIKWSMIGHLQTNKVRDAISFASEIQSLDRISLAVALDRKLQALGKGIDVLVQVNTSNETSKYGVAPNTVLSFLRELKSFSSLKVKGFMTLATFTQDEMEVRRCFRKLHEVRTKSLNEAPQGDALTELSMGMSGDFEWAIEEGATTVRVGQAVFGARSHPPSYYWPGILDEKNL